MTKEEFYLKFKNYKLLVNSIYKVADGFDKDIEFNGRLNILIPGLSQIGILYTSMIKLIPEKDGNLDISSICSISRMILEFTNTLYFYGIEKVDDNELEFRIELFNYLAEKELFEEAKHMDKPIRELNKVGLTKNEIRNQFDNLIQNEVFVKLESEKVISKDNIVNSKYLDRKSLQNRRKIKQSIYDTFYSFYSTFVHNSPAAIKVYHDFSIHIDERSEKYYDYVVALFDICSGYVSNLIIEMKELTFSWSTILEKSEIDILNEFSKNVKQ